MADKPDISDDVESDGMEVLNDDCEVDEPMEGEEVQDKVYIPGKSEMDGEELVYDESAYIMYHQAQTGAPCLSFDILRDPLGDKREEFPMTCFAVCGTQSAKGETNHVIAMRMSNLHKTKVKNKEEEDDDEEEEEEDDDEKPELETALLSHNGTVNRIRASIINSKPLAATWSEIGVVYIWDLTRPLHAINDSSVMAAYTRNEESPAPIFSFKGHQGEGYAMDWSPNTAGKLATGDCKKNIHVWTPQDGGTWHVDQRPYAAHTDSVEDLQWSPNEVNVLASCSVDKTIRIWDIRAAPSKACMLTVTEAHGSDVNVINWNKNEPYIVSGGDDGVIKVWDLRQFQSGKSVAAFKHHTAPITSVEWNPNESSVFAASGADDQISIWDLAIEGEEKEEGEEDVEVPPQLLFIHQGQSDIKELHWHPQCPGVILSTAESGFNVFKTISV